MKDKDFVSHPIKGVIPIAELTESEAMMILTSIPMLGVMRILKLLNHFGSSHRALLADPNEIAALPGFGPKLAIQWPQWRDAENWKQNLRLVDKANVELIPIGSKLYPKRLLELPDPPPLLYGRGNLSLLHKPSIAVIGTRQASIYGCEMAKKFSEEFARAGLVVISGLARGIDTCAHQGALAAGNTAAVIGSGLSNIYPGENAHLSRQICDQGYLLSEFAMATPPDRQNFPQRNRIVAALTEAILLVEAPLKSGAMLTMYNGRALRKKLFALPGRVDNKNFCGNHALIKSRDAEIVESPNDILDCLDNLFHIPPPAPLKKSQAIPLDKEEVNLLQLMPIEEFSIDEIAMRCQLPIARVNTLLMGLVLKDVVQEFPGRIYKKHGKAQTQGAHRA